MWKRVINPLIDEFLATINIPVEKWAKKVTIQLTEELKMARVNAKITWVLIKEMLNWRRPLPPAELAKIKKINTQYLQKSRENGNCLDSVPKSILSISCQEANLTRRITSQHTSSSSIWELILRYENTEVEYINCLLLLVFFVSCLQKCFWTLRSENNSPNYLLKVFAYSQVLNISTIDFLVRFESGIQFQFFLYKYSIVFSIP